MRIRRISLQNFRQYRKAEFDFPKNKQDVHVIIGQNGVGKTTLYNALNWCLYEEEPRSYKEDNTLPIVNLNTIESTEEGKSVDVIVEVVFDDDTSGRSYTFRRSGTYIIEGKNARKYNIEFDAIINDKGQIDSMERDAAKRLLGKVVPKEIREFFFFDGEKLDNYFSDKQSNDRIYSAVFNISQVEVLDVVARRINDVVEELNRTASKSIPSLDLIQKQIDRLEVQQGETKERLKNTNYNIAEAQKVVSSCHEFLKNIPDISSLENERTRLINERYTSSGNIHQYRIDLRNLIREYSIVFLAEPALRQVSSLIMEKKRRNELPPKIDNKLLEMMLSENRCKVCNRELDDEAREHIHSVLEQIRLGSELSALLLETDVTVQNYLSKISEYSYKRDRILDPLTKNEKDLDRIEKRISDIDSTLVSFGNKEEIVRKQEERKNNENQLKKLNGDVLFLEATLRRISDEIEEQKEKRDDIYNKTQKLKVTKQRLELLKRAAEKLQRVEDSLMKANRKSIQEYTDKTFKRLIWKKDYFSRVEINEDYSLILYNTKDYSCLGSISAAERALLALSYTLALHNVSGFEPPLVIDTPVARISDDNRKSFGKVLMDVGKEKQIILLFTPAEYSEEIEKEMQSSLSSFRRLELTNGQEILVV